MAAQRGRVASIGGKKSRKAMAGTQPAPNPRGKTAGLEPVIALQFTIKKSIHNFDGREKGE